MSDLTDNQNLQQSCNNLATDTISRQAAIESLDDEITITGASNAYVFRDYVRRVKRRLENLPSAEPKVIQCKDCKHRAVVRDPDRGGGFGLEFPDDECPCNCDDPYYAWRPDDNWYCPKGERS